MDKIKNLVNPGSKKDDEVMYGSGMSDDPVHSGNTGTQSGQGSHFGNTRTAGNDPLSSFDHPTSAGAANTGYGSTASNNDPLSTSTNPTGSSQYDNGNASRGTHGLNEPYASRMPGGFDDDAATTASVRSGVPGQATHTGSGMMGHHDPSLTNKPLPNEPASAGTGNLGSSGNTMGGNSLSGNSYPDRSVGSSGYGNQPTDSSHLGRDAALGAGAVGAGTAAHHHHDNNQRDNYAPETGRSFPLSGSNTGAASSYPAGGSTTTGPQSSNAANTAYPSGQTGTYPASGSVAAGPHSSNLANRADPRVDTDLDGSRTTGQTGYGLTTGATPGSAQHGSMGRDAALGAGAGAPAGGLTSGSSGYGPESWKHEHGTHGHTYEGDPCGPGETATGGPHLIPGPHATDTANRLDPHVAGGSGAIEPSTSHHHGHRKEDAALVGGATGAGLGAYEGSRDHQTTRDGPSGANLGSTIGAGDRTTGPAPNTAGPHKSDMFNKLDPRVDSDLSKEQSRSGTTGQTSGSSTTGTSDPYSSQHSGHHRGEEAALGGAGLGGAAAYESSKHHHQNEPNFSHTAPGASSSTSPYSGSALDPRVESGRSGMDKGPASGAGRDHHLGRDAGLAAGAGGLATEAERHHGQPTQSTHIPSNATRSAYDNTRDPSGYDQAGSRLAGSSQQPATTKDHHYGRDAALGAGAGGAVYEADKHLGRDHRGAGYAPQDQLAGSGHQPATVGSGMSSSTQPHETRPDHHLGRDAAIGGTGLGAGAAGIEDHRNRHPGDSVATYPSPGYGNERSAQDPSRHSHRKEEEALAGGAAAGGLAHHEHSKKDEKALEKEHTKELKQHEKDEKALEKEHTKELKQHEKALDKEHNKEIKQHEKALEKDQKAHEKERAKHMAAIEKDQKKHEHEQQKHEHDGEKKKGGLLGFLHRDKPDKELKEDEARRKASGEVAHRPGVGDEEMSAGAGAQSYDDPLAGEHGSQSGVHDTPIGAGRTTHDAYGTQEGHNKLHKDPPNAVGTQAAHGADYQGHGNMS